MTIRDLIQSDEAALNSSDLEGALAPYGREPVCEWRIHRYLFATNQPRA